jgi:threonine synthase
VRFALQSEAINGRPRQLNYVSTRGEAPPLGFEDVLLAGLARDGGLYVPETWPTLAADQIAALAGKPFADVAVEVIHPFVGDTVARAELGRMTAAAYARFDHPAVTPLVQVAPNRWILELFHGPTLAFKDVAMLLLAQLMDRALAKGRRRATIIGATSGDTGGAAIEAFRGSERVEVVILFPQGRVSDVQRRMMTVPTDANVHAVAVKGTFDDCQALVKGMFNDHAFRDRLSLSGVNSINWARIAGQLTYYFTAAVALGAPFRPVSFAVPTGNFGDIFAAYVAKRMGLPIEQLVIASNVNDILPRALASGSYEMRDVVATSSPSMDIQISSNFERYLFEASGRDASLIRDKMRALAATRRFDLGALKEKFDRDFAAAAASEQDVADAIRRMKAECGYLVDPHTACGIVAADQALGNSGATPQVVLSTAHPAKFPDAIEAITGERPPLPERFATMLTARERLTSIPNDLEAAKSRVEELTRVAVEGRG